MWSLCNCSLTVPVMTCRTLKVEQQVFNHVLIARVSLPSTASHTAAFRPQNGCFTWKQNVEIWLIPVNWQP